MKYLNHKSHICADCGTSPCKYHDEDTEIDGWDATYIPKDDNGNYGHFRIKQCPYFTDGSDCKTCANFTKCKMVLPYGETCEKYTRRAKKSSRDRMVQELKDLSMLMTPDECEAMMYFLIGLAKNDTTVEYKLLQHQAKLRVSRLKIVATGKVRGKMKKGAKCYEW